MCCVCGCSFTLCHTVLSKEIQYDHLDTLAALSSLLRSIKEIEKLSSTPVAQWPTYVSTISKCTTTDGSENTSTVYQSQRLKQYDTAKLHFANIVRKSVTA